MIDTDRLTIYNILTAVFMDDYMQAEFAYAKSKRHDFFMKINLARFIKSCQEIIEFDFEFKPAENILDVDVLGELSVNGRLMNRYGEITLDGEIIFKYETQCDRCLAPLSRDFTLEFEHRIIPEADDEHPDAIIAENDLIVDSIVIDDLILNLPSKHLCKDDCKGLCPKCGKDLNNLTESHSC